MNRHYICTAFCAVTAISIVVSLLGCGGGSSRSTPLPPSALAFLSSAPLQASEGNVYTYTVQTTIEGASLALTTSPSGARLSGTTITWTPNSQQARTANQFTVAATYAGAMATQSWSVTPNGTIRGTTADTCISDSGQTTLIADSLWGATVQVLVPKSGGRFDMLSSTVAQDGTFAVANVPAGSFWLMLPYTNLWTSSSTVDLGFRNWGGCRKESPSSAGTSLQSSVSGLNPWQYYDYFYFAVPNARSGKGAIASVGASSLSFEIPYNNLLLWNSLNRDNAYFAQLVTANYGGIDFHALKRFAGPEPVTIQNGAVNTLNASLQPVPQSSTFRANIRGSAFTALHENMFPGATAVSTPGDNLRIDISADKNGPASNGLFLVLASQAFPTDTDAGDVAFANPYPETWAPFVDYTDMVILNLVPAGATSPIQPVLKTRVVSADVPTATNPITPLVGPALNPQIDGVSLFTNQTINGPTPTLSWQPPTVGTASGYLITVQQIVVNNGVPEPPVEG